MVRTKTTARKSVASTIRRLVAKAVIRNAITKNENHKISTKKKTTTTKATTKTTTTRTTTNTDTSNEPSKKQSSKKSPTKKTIKERRTNRNITTTPTQRSRRRMAKKNNNADQEEEGDGSKLVTNETVEKDPNDTTGMVTTRKSYTIEEKLAAIEYMKEHGLRPSSRTLSIPLASLKRWRREVISLQQLSKCKNINPTIRTRKIYKGTRAMISSDMEDQLIYYIQQKWNEQDIVTIETIVQKLYELQPHFITVKPHVLRQRLWRIFHRRNIIMSESSSSSRTAQTAPSQPSRIMSDDSVIGIISDQIGTPNNTR